jgi:hypothetical protein
MIQILNRFLDFASNYFASRKGLLPLLGILLILVNLGFQLFFETSWLARTNLFMHFGLILAIFGFMLAWAL